MRYVYSGLSLIFPLALIVTTASFQPLQWSTGTRRTPSPSSSSPSPSSSSTLLSMTRVPKSTYKITIPQRHPSDQSPNHPQNTYPSKLHTIHVLPILTPAQASHILHIATEHATRTQCWSTKDSDRHVSYSTADFAIEDCTELEQYLNTSIFGGVDIDVNIEAEKDSKQNDDGLARTKNGGELTFQEHVFGIIAELFDVDVSDLEFMDLFCAHYEGRERVGHDSEGGEGTRMVMDRLEPHRDGTLISFTIVLSPPDAYQGGGTVFDALIDADIDVSDNSNGSNALQRGGVIKVQTAGEAVLHCGKIKHGADTVTSGKRTTITAFIDVNDRCIRNGVLANACKWWGRMDTCARRLTRQEQKMKRIQSSDGDEGRCKWELSSTKYVRMAPTERVGRSHLQGTVPLVSSVQKRGSYEHRRRKNLETEDILLRDVLLKREDRKEHPSDMFDLSQFGDITIL